MARCHLFSWSIRMGSPLVPRSWLGKFGSPISFSVDPEKDTPQVLRGYADKLQANPGRWDFLTGPKSAIYKLSHDGFKLAVSEGSGEQGIPVHSTRMVLVDRHGDIRGYFDATEADAITKVVADTNHLLREQPQ